MSSTKTGLGHGLICEIKPVETKTDPAIRVYCVELTADKAGAWRETFGSREALEAFIRGLQAGASMVAKKHIRRPEMP